MKKKIILIITLILPIFFLATTGKVEASYNYSPWDEAIESAVSKSYRLNAAKSSRTRNILNRSDEKVHYRS